MARGAECSIAEIPNAHKPPKHQILLRMLVFAWKICGEPWLKSCLVQWVLLFFLFSVPGMEVFGEIQTSMKLALKENVDLSDFRFTGVISLNPSLNVYIILQQFMSNGYHGLDGWDTRRSSSPTALVLRTSSLLFHSKNTNHR